MASDIKEEILFELSEMAQYIFEPKTSIIKIQKKFDITIGILTKILNEIQQLYKTIESDEIIINQDDIPDIVARFNDVIDKVIKAYNKWFEMSNGIKNSMQDLYNINTDMQEIRIDISTLINNVVGGYSI